MIKWLFGGGVSARLNPIMAVKVHGIRFMIRKLNPLDYLTGAKALHQIYDTYKRAGKSLSDGFEEKDVAKIKSHYRDTFMAGVVSMRCAGVELLPTRSEKVDHGDAKIPVDHFMTDWDLAEELYQAIVVFTYGKKKMRAILRSQKTAS